jgi:hypothetical protein
LRNSAEAASLIAADDLGEDLRIRKRGSENGTSPILGASRAQTTSDAPFSLTVTTVPSGALKCSEVLPGFMVFPSYLCSTIP